MAPRGATNRRDAETEKLPLFKGIRVLLVDDDIDSVDVVCAILQHGDAIVTSASSAAHAMVEYVNAGGAFDVLISDLAMPNRDGLWLVRQLKREAHDDGRMLWTIALTAHAEEPVRQAAIEAGFDAFLTKPFEFEDLANAVLLRRPPPATDGRP